MNSFLRWFDKLNGHFSVEGRSSFFYKPVGTNKTLGVSGEIARDRLLEQLTLKNTAFIYHCHNHYCCPVGYEREPVDKTNIYNEQSSASNQEFVEWIFIADTSRKYGNFHCVKWSDIDADLNTKSPVFLNIRDLDKGMQVRCGNEPLAESNNNDKDESQGPLSENEDDEAIEKMNNYDELRKCFKKDRNLHCLIKFESFDRVNLSLMMARKSSDYFVNFYEKIDLSSAS